MLLLRINKYTPTGHMFVRDNRHLLQRAFPIGPRIVEEAGEKFFILKSDIKAACTWDRPLVPYRGRFPRLGYLWARLKETVNG